MSGGGKREFGIEGGGSVRAVSFGSHYREGGGGRKLCGGKIT